MIVPLVNLKSLHGKLLFTAIKTLVLLVFTLKAKASFSFTTVIIKSFTFTTVIIIIYCNNKDHRLKTKEDIEVSISSLNLLFNYFAC